MASYREKVPQRFLCPITLMPMHDPVADPCGHSYERSAILAWLKKSPTSPMTRTFLAPAMLKTNFALRAQIEAQKVRRTCSGATVLLCCAVLWIGLSLRHAGSLLLAFSIPTACGSGDALVSGTCVPCPAGTFAGKFWGCSPCDPGSWSDEGSSACSCNKGWTAAGGTGGSMCTKCPANTFKAARGPSGCQACPRGSVSPEGSEAVKQCVSCPAGTFAGQAGSCEPCSVGSWSDEGSSACSCNKGWTAAGGDGGSMCTKCPANTFKAARGPSGCQACPFGFASQEGSEELMDCAPEGVINGLTGGVMLMLKGIGVLGEEPPERRWRQQMTSALALAQVSARVRDAMSDIYSRVTRAVLDLFASLAEFYSARALHEQADANVCSSEKTLKAWLVRQDEYAVWRQAVSAVRRGRGWNMARECAQMKKSARRVLLILHPDKLQLIHPTCAQGRGAFLAADFNAEYDTQKRLCAGH